MKQAFKNFFNKIGAGMHKVFGVFKKNKTEHKIHSRFGALVAVQYRDKVDMSWTKETKTIIRKCVLSVLKFVIIVALVVVVLNLVKMIFGITTQILSFYMVFLGIFLILNLITVSFGLVKSLYYAEDNKVLATYPAKSSTLFLSKIVVYELFELRKSLDILIPISLGFLITGYTFKVLQLGAIFWSIIPLATVVTMVVLIGSLLSIPFLYIYKLFKRFPLVEAFVIVLAVAGVISLLIYVISIIPSAKGDIDINRMLPVIEKGINDFINGFSKYLSPVYYLFRSVVGETGRNYIGYKVTAYTLGRFGILFAITAGLLVLVYFIIKPFYFKMMTKSFEFNKEKIDNQKKNKVRNKYWSFSVKEFKLTFRDFEISGSCLCVYIAAPILLLFINKIFGAMTTSTDGDIMITTFSTLLILLPLLASSTVVSTLYSREGRTAYMKKTKPIKPYFPLLAKILFNLILSVPSIIACCVIFAKFEKISTTAIVLLFFIALFLQYGHIFFSASLDIMNPQNEVYATEGTSVSNPNERTSTIVAFVFSILISLALFFLMREEQYQNAGNLDPAFIKIFIVAIVTFASCLLLFILKIKAFYIDRQEASRE